MFASIGKALRLLLDPWFFGTLFKAVALTILLFVVMVVGVEALLWCLPSLGSPLVNKVLELLAPLLAIFGLFLLGGPVAALFAGLFLDGIAARIEARDYPGDPPAPGTPFWTGLRAGIALAGAVIGIDLVLLPFDLVLPGLAELATLTANGWILGREYFELAALRHLPRDQAAALRVKHRGQITAGGMTVALMTMVPLLNLIAPLFATALMVHLFKRIQKRDAP